jgi:sulfofructosephosphate aldolase
LSHSFPSRAGLYSSISTQANAFAMVAMDQRDSLRTMMRAHTTTAVPDAKLVTFKVTVASLLSPHASAFLIDTEYGLRPILEANALYADCGLIVAADVLQQVSGAAVEGTSIDPSVDPCEMRELGASALKLLVICKADEPSNYRVEMVGTFVEACHAADILALVEPVVRPPQTSADLWNRDSAILEAAEELGGLGMDVYKAEVPAHGQGDPEAIVAQCRAITAALPCPWVVLSQGVAVADFPTAVQAACRGGASGFLAGRAVWSDTLSGNPRTEIQRVSVPRLQALRQTVEHLARPWTDVVRP